MATISSQSTRTSGRAGNYAKKDAVAISAAGATVQGFERRLREIRRAHGKDGLRPRAQVDENGKPLSDTNGDYVVAKDSKGNTVYEAKYVEAYSLVQSFGHDELDPDDPDSWTRANALGRAIAADRFPGHPVLIATEVNGRSGCVHNHIIAGAVHAKTGKSIDSNVVAHSRLALAHDRVLAEQGFEQRSDMKQVAAAAAERMEERRQAATAEPGFTDLSPSQQERRLTAAENSVRFEGLQQLTPHQQREDRRQRELHRYELREQERDAAIGVGAAPPPERFSELVLESRIRQTLSDPRAQSCSNAAQVGRENGVVITRRGDDVSYGMMLAQSDGTITEPARAHIRRGKRLGDEYQIEAVDAAIGLNARRQQTDDRQQEDQATAEAPIARIARIVREGEETRSRFDDAREESNRFRHRLVEAEQWPVGEKPQPEPVVAEGPPIDDHEDPAQPHAEQTTSTADMSPAMRKALERQQAQRAKNRRTREEGWGQDGMGMG